MSYYSESFHGERKKVMCLPNDSTIPIWVGVINKSKEVCYFKEISDSQRQEATDFLHQNGIECYYNGRY